MSDRPRRLLILACSAAKRPDPGLMPAIERYDGPAFKVLRKYLRETGGPGPAVWVLSAEHGLIRGDRPIEDYDRRMDRARAAALAPGVARDWAVAFAGVSEVAVSVGKVYRLALPAQPPPGILWTVLGGGLGVRLTRLRAWLRAGY